LEELLEIPTDHLPQKILFTQKIKKTGEKVLKPFDFRTFLGAATQI